MIEQGPTSEKENVSLEETLRSASAQIHALEEAAHTALHRDRDAAAYKERLKEKATILIGLPKKLDAATEGGESFPEAERASLMGIEALAKSMLDQDNYFGMGTLLTQKGSHIGELDDLERLIDRVYPSKEKDPGKQ